MKKSIIKNSSIIIIITTISKVIGFVKDVLVAYAYGTTYETDAYNVSLTIPILAFSLIGVAVNTTFIPIFARILKAKGKKEMFKVANKLLTILFILIICIYLVIRFNITFITKAIAPDFNNTTLSLTVELAKICMVNLFFISLYSVFASILQTMQEFISTSLVAVVINIPIIVYILFNNNLSIIGLTFATVIGYGFQVLIQIPWLIKHEYRYRLTLNLKDEAFDGVWKKLIPVMIGAGIMQINSFVDQIMASGLQEGSISALGLAAKVNAIVYGVFAGAILTAIYPVLASEIENLEVIKKYITKSLFNISLVIFPSTMGIMVLTPEIVKVLFMRGVFDEASVYLTSSATFFLAVGVLFYGGRDVISEVFYALGDTITPMKSSILGVVANIILDVLLAKFMGVGGLAFATSISAATTTIILYINLKKKIRISIINRYMNDMYKMIFASIIMGICVLVSKMCIIRLNETFLTAKLIFLVSIGILVYFITLRILNTHTLEENINIVISKIDKFKSNYSKQNQVEGKN